MPTSEGEIKNEHEIELYGHSLFVFLHDRIKTFIEEEGAVHPIKFRQFSFDSNKETSISSRYDFLLHFEIPTSESKTKQILWVFEFKCNKNAEQGLKAAKKDLETKLSDLKEIYKHFKDCEKTFIAANLGFCKIQSAIIFKENKENQLEEVLKWPDTEDM